MPRATAPAGSPNAGPAGTAATRQANPTQQVPSLGNSERQPQTGTETQPSTGAQRVGPSPNDTTGQSNNSRPLADPNAVSLTPNPPRGSGGSTATGQR